jgi:hypothetical protein
VADENLRRQNVCRQNGFRLKDVEPFRMLHIAKDSLEISVKPNLERFNEPSGKEAIQRVWLYYKTFYFVT